MEKETEQHGEMGKFLFCGGRTFGWFLLTVDVGPVSTQLTEGGEFGLNLRNVSWLRIEAHTRQFL